MGQRSEPMTITLPAAKRKITREDILPMDTYGRERAALRQNVVAIKRHRRLEVGPVATFYFENYQTMWHQVHEMLFIEKGGDAQIEDELRAYNPLIPNGSELVATVMFEIDDPVRRARTLLKLGGVDFPLTAAQKSAFRAAGARIVLGFDHPEYGHMTVLPEATRAALASDLGG
jgi:hypothetical protein